MTAEMQPSNNKRKAEMSDTPAATPSKRRVVAKPKKRLSIPGAYPTAELSSQETSRRSAHSVISARKANSRHSENGAVAQVPRTRSKTKASSHRIEKPATREPSTPKRRSSGKKNPVVTPRADRQTKSQDASLRFSFSSQPAGPLKKGRRRGRPAYAERTYTPTLAPIESPTRPATPSKEDKVLNRSFSELLVSTAQNNLTGPLLHDYTDTPSDLSSEPNQEPPKAPDPSVFSHPTKKREGYGFSYSEPLWYDSDEYPDTECDWDPDDDRRTASFKQGIALFDHDSPFEDMVVMRDLGSFHMAKPQRILPCTKATREDTLRLKQKAKALLKWDESGDVYAGLVSRLERMVHTDVGKKIGGSDTMVHSVVRCATRLEDFLQRVKEDRIETGESRRAAEHEIEWAAWLVEASQTGVMHLKTRGCTCRPDWEED